jgi:hypothetical protein
VEMPAEPLLDAGALPHLVLSVVQQQLDVTFDADEMSLREVRVTQRRVGDREGVDAIGLARGAGGATGAGHDLGRDPNDRLARAIRKRARLPDT